MTKLEKALCERIDNTDKLVQKQKECIDLLKQEIEVYKGVIERLQKRGHYDDPFD